MHKKTTLLRRWLRKYTALVLVVIVVAVLGTYFLVFSKAATITAASVEVEAMSAPVGASIFTDASASNGKAMLFKTTGESNGPVTLKLAADKIIIRAKGTQCSGAPQMVVKIDNVQVLTTAVSATSWSETYSIPVTVTEGSHTVGVSFTNPYTQYKKGNGRVSCSRSLSVDKITMTGTIADEVVPPTTGNELALNKPATASSAESSTYAAMNANDGSTSTRWASTIGLDNQYWQVDLGSEALVSQVDINWEAAYASNYSIQASADGNNYRTIAEVTNTQAGNKSTTFTETKARYIRIYAIARGTQWGFSIWETKIYGTGTTTVTPPPVTPTGSIYLGALMKGEEYQAASPKPTTAPCYAQYQKYTDTPWDCDTYDKFESNAGKKISILHYRQPAPWFQTTFYGDVADKMTSRGAIPLISMFSSRDQPTTQPEIQLRDIANGSYDTQIKAWATNVKNYGKPFFLRFNWEMNGNWYEYGRQAKANPADYVDAWRHFHDVTVANGATNINWVWCPNIVHTGSTPLTSLYPGEAYVDWTCMDGYNFAGTRNAPWLSFTGVFQQTYSELLSLAPNKPIMIAETSSSELGGSKPAWITSALRTELPNNFPKVKALIWFNWRIEENGVWHDWPIESSAASQQAFRDGISSPYYSSNNYGSLPPLSKIKAP